MMKQLLQVSMSNDRDDLPSDANDVNDAFSCNNNDGVSTAKAYITEQKYLQKYIQELTEERETLKALWKKEFEEEQQRNQSSSTSPIDWCNVSSIVCSSSDAVYRMFSYAEVFLSNMPLTIGALGLCWGTQGTIWFKFMEENIDACQPAYFYSPQCTYPEFPGCFECDTTNSTYQVALTFHYFCHLVALTCCLMFVSKCFLAWKVVADELSNPATATPIGVVCITLICVAAGRLGAIGEWVVLIVSAFHVLISFWFIYMAVIVFRLQPDPSWFPCTVGIAYAAIKTWLYYPMPGFFIMVLCILYFFTTFFVAIYRAAVNYKITAPVCFISLSAPSITMYAMTIMAQPQPEQMSQLADSPEMKEWWLEVHRRAYLPIMHFMMFLSLVGFVASLQCLVARWPEFKKKAFSPAHVAFIFPLLSHTNAVQAYRSGVIAYSSMPVGSPYKVILWNYWFACLLVGTTLNLVFTCKYVRRLPEWTKVNATPDPLEDEPPEPQETEVHSLWWSQDNNHEYLKQSFVNPALLQANEAGALIRVRRGTEAYKEHGKYIRTRHVTAYGFDLVMSDDELRQERAELLDWVAKNKARPRHRTLSIPHYFKLVSARGQSYGSIAKTAASVRDSHRRTQTLGATLHLPV